MKEALRSVPLFADLGEADLDELAADASIAHLDKGELLFREGDEGDRAYVITRGEIEIFKVNGARETLLAVRGAGDVIGEMALLNAAPRMASARAMDAVDVMLIPKAALDRLLSNSATAARGLFRVLLDRWAQTETMLRQAERMAQLGTLTAGLAHELNNPAAAVVSSAQQMKDAIEQLRSSLLALSGSNASPDVGAVGELIERAAQPPVEMSALDRSDREAELEDTLTGYGVDQPWAVAADLASAGFTVEDLESASENLGAVGPNLWAALQASHRIASLQYIVEEGASRLSAIVGALKSYSYLDQAPQQEVDVRTGLDDTLLILQSKLSDITVEKAYEDVPEISAYAAELNQVWTNLLDNAADAIHGSRDEGGHIRIRVTSNPNDVVVEIEDNGGGIAEQDVPRIFDSFFTTKPPGAGTGLGLDITYNVVVHKHRGEITVHPRDGGTMFRVALPQNR